MAYSDLNQNQRDALKALLETRTIAEAADRCDVTERTVYRYLSDPVFRRELTQREGLRIFQTTQGLLELNEKAVEALADLLDDPDQAGATNLRLTAQAILQNTIKLRELWTVEHRLNELEESVYEN